MKSISLMFLVSITIQELTGPIVAIEQSQSENVKARNIISNNGSSILNNQVEKTIPSQIKPLIAIKYSENIKPREWLLLFISSVPAELISANIKKNMIEMICNEKLTYIFVNNIKPAAQFENSTGIVFIDEKFIKSQELIDKLQILISLRHELTHAIPYINDNGFYSKTMNKIKNKPEANFKNLLFIFDSESQAYYNEIETITEIYTWFKENSKYFPDKLYNYDKYSLGPLPPWKTNRKSFSIINKSYLAPLIAYRAVTELKENSDRMSSSDKDKIAKYIFKKYPYLYQWHIDNYGYSK